VLVFQRQFRDIPIDGQSGCFPNLLITGVGHGCLLSPDVLAVSRA
jgi:hypothetical protein